jgi:organic radical activating enzyme
MSYLQITTKCNMTCKHCGYACSRKGKHMEYHRVLDALKFLSNEMDYEMLSIGGGEPTMHPRFFDILKMSLWHFRYVWMATNGSKTHSMKRLSHILDGEEQTFQERKGEYYDVVIMDHEDHLTVALSLDYYHSPINGAIESLWKQMSKHQGSGYEIRNIFEHGNGAVKSGRAEKNMIWEKEDCICSGLFVTIEGNLKPCGCLNAPIIGDIYSGISEDFKDYMNSDKYHNSECWTQSQREED